jgi:hypothetical protein
VLRRKQKPVSGPGPRDVVISAVAALATNDRQAIADMDGAFRKLTVEEILGALGDFGLMLKPGLKPEQRKLMQTTIQNELTTQPLSDDQKAAAAQLSNALLVDADPEIFDEAMADHVSTMQEGYMPVVMGCMMATASVVNELEIKLNFK